MTTHASYKMCNLGKIKIKNKKMFIAWDEALSKLDLKSRSTSFGFEKLTCLSPRSKFMYVKTITVCLFGHYVITNLPGKCVIFNWSNVNVNVIKNKSSYNWKGLGVRKTHAKYETYCKTKTVNGNPFVLNKCIL